MKATNPASWVNVTVDTTPAVALNDPTLPCGKEIVASSPANVLIHVVNERHLRGRSMLFTTNTSPLTA